MSYTLEKGEVPRATSFLKPFSPVVADLGNIEKSDQH